MKNEYVKVKYPKIKLILGITLLIVLGTAMIVQHTVLVREYLINTIVTVIVKNSINIFFISLLLIIINVLEIKSIKRKINQGEGEY